MILKQSMHCAFDMVAHAVSKAGLYHIEIDHHRMAFSSSLVLAMCFVRSDFLMQSLCLATVSPLLLLARIARTNLA